MTALREGRLPFENGKHLNLWREQPIPPAFSVLDSATDIQQIVAAEDYPYAEDSIQLIDLSDYYVFPGLFESHTHICMALPPSKFGGNMRDYFQDLEPEMLVRYLDDEDSDQQQQRWWQQEYCCWQKRVPQLWDHYWPM